MPSVSSRENVHRAEGENSMWRVEEQRLDSARGTRLRFRADGHCMSYRQVLRGWADQAEFRECFMQQIRRAPFTALRWETPAICLERAQREFECVLLDSPALDVVADSRDFLDYLQGDAAVVDFSNLGGDARLVVPGCLSGTANYCHLAAFHRSAPIAQQHALWQRVAACVEPCLSDRPLWVSTAGGGVDWLHVRLDERPKYYAYSPYRTG